jgi:hypothetical protein
VDATVGGIKLLLLRYERCVEAVDEAAMYTTMQPRQTRRPRGFQELKSLVETKEASHTPRTPPRRVQVQTTDPQSQTSKVQVTLDRSRKIASLRAEVADGMKLVDICRFPLFSSLTFMLGSQ